MFTYCLNNPVIMGDDEGMDAVVLIDNEGANGFGHVGFLAQDSEGVWWHFYWGPSMKVPCLFGTVKETTWCRRYDGEISLDAINDAGQYGDSYDKMMYFNGDFSNSVTQAKSYGKTQNYNLYSRNCSQVSFSLLAESPNDNQVVFRTASTKMIPKSAYKYTAQNRVRKNSGKVIAMTV